MEQKAQPFRLVNRAITSVYLFHAAKIVIFYYMEIEISKYYT